MYDIYCPHCHAQLNPPRLRAALALLRELDAYLSGRPTITPAITELRGKIAALDGRPPDRAASVGWPGTPDERAP